MFEWLFNTDQFVPRRVCGSWSEELILLHNIADLGIFSAYVAIPLLLAYFMHKKKGDIPPGFGRVVWLFALFILSCGTTHLIGFLVFRYPMYHLDGVIKILCAAASWATVVAMVPLIPKLLSMKSPDVLQQEIDRRIAAEKLLQEERDRLEHSVQDRTKELLEVNNLLREQMEARQIISGELATQAKDLSALQKATIQTCAILDSLMQLAPVGMVFFDQQGRYIRINNWMANVNGHTPEEHIGKTVEEMVPNVATVVKVRLQEVLLDNNPIIDHEVSGALADGRKRNWLVSYYPVSTPDNTRLGVGVVVKDVTEQKQLENELRKRVSEVTESDRQKTEFLAMLAHELRNPLAPIMNSVYLLDLASDAAESHHAERTQARKVISRQVQHMSRLLDDLLDVARINRGKITLRKEAVDINTVLRRVAANSKDAAETRHHTVTINLADHPLITNADATRLEQIFGNIYNNAIKYTEPGGRIEIRSSVCENWITVSIKDNGIGISQTTLPKMFEIFAQASRSLDRANGGLGVGLALAQDLVRMHGGKIEARSDGLGHGSEFIVRLPLMQVQNYKPIDDEEDQNHLPIANKPLKILIVDDNVDAAESLAMLLNRGGHETQMVYDGATALKKVNAYRPDVILLDIGLPGLDGYTCCELLRESHYNGLIIAITGYGSSEDRSRSKEAGFNQHLTKPVSPIELTNILNHYAETKEVS